jgi:PAS domain S-box-containing protein
MVVPKTFDHRMSRWQDVLSLCIPKVSTIRISTLGGGLVLALFLGLPATAQETKNVLVIYGNTAELPWVKIFDASLRSSVTGSTSQRVDFYTEYFDVARFPALRHHDAFLELVRARYADRKIDVVVLGGATAFDFIMSRRKILLPNVPIVFSFLPPDRVKAPRLPPNVIGVQVDFGPMPTIELALRLHPGTKRVVLVTGSGAWDRDWEKRLRQETSVLRDRVELEFLAGLPRHQLVERLSQLPKGTVVFTPGYFNDGDGTAVVPREEVEAMAAKSVAPIYVAYETYVGTGAVGGVIPTFSAVGQQTGRIVATLLEDKPLAALQLPRVLKGEPLVDWRQLGRWGIDQKLLPAGTVVRFKLPSVWEQYLWYIIGVLTIIAVQAVLIVGLLMHRARRRRAEAELRESQELTELVIDAGELGLYMRDLERGEVWANRRLRSLFGCGETDELRFDDLLERIHADDRGRVIAAVERAQQPGVSFDEEFRIVLPHGSERWMMARGRTTGPAGRRMGVVFDITERKQAEERSRDILEAAPNAVIMVNREGNIGLVNAAVEAVFGYTRNEIMGCPIEVLIPERFRKRHSGDREGYFADPEIRTMGAGRELFGRRKDGSEVPVEVRLSPIRTPQGLFVLASIIDVTARKQAEHDLNAAFGEIRGLKERLEEENLYLKEEISEVKGFDEIVGKSDALKYVLTRVEQVAKTDATVLLQGETGVGKELIARAIHEKSSRSNGPLVKVNCAALPDTLVESELFGHEKGAFTGADRQRKGRFELAAGGTILLDEVGELPLGTQAKLLRVLQEGEFERVGGSATLKANARVLAATNRKLHEEVSAGRFRQDLFYRLNVYPITVPPLRQRREDIPMLVTHYARQLGERMGKNISEVPAQVMREFTEYNWPGNIRELLNVIERAVIVSSDGVLRLPEPLGQAATGFAAEAKSSEASTSVATADDAERKNILRALEATGWRINGPKGAAELLRLHPSTLRFRMKKLGLTKISGYMPQVQKSDLH